MTDKYADMIYMLHHVSKKHPQMPLLDRAAQFAPFAADMVQPLRNLNDKPQLLLLCLRNR